MNGGITVEHFHTENKGTVYEVTVVRDLVDNYIILMPATGLSLYFGEWVRLPLGVVGRGGIAWNYLTEKMPGLAKHAGDKDGWIKAFGEAGIQVFR